MAIRDGNGAGIAVEAVCFLASRRAGSITGQHLRIEDGPVAPASDRVDVAGVTPVVAFLCVHNAGRSQMAAGFLRHLAPGRVDDPAGQGIEAVRPIRDEIAAKVLDLMSRLGVEPKG